MDLLKPKFEISNNNDNNNNDNNRTVIINNKRLTYTNDQLNAKYRILDWLNNTVKGNNFFVLEGAAGTGKTTLLKDIIRSCNKHNIIATAPTHKAVHVIATIINIKTATIHKLLGLRLSYNINKVSDKNFEQVNEPKIKEYNFVIIDESSMIPKQLELLIVKEANFYNVKILFLGDKYQLPAVDNNSIFLNNYKNKFSLNEIVRQSEDNPLINLLSILRNDIKTGTFNFLKEIKLHNKVITNDKGYEVVKKQDFIDKLLFYYKSNDFSKDINYCKYLAYTNDNINIWNKFIRNKITISDSIIDVNDYLLGYENIIDEYNDLIITNSEDYYIKYITEININNIDGYNVTIVENYSKKESTIFLVNHLNPSFNTFIDYSTNLINMAKTSYGIQRKTNWRNYYDFKNKYILMIDIILNEYGNKDTIKKSIDYGYCMTTHKSQGSTYNKIFINMLNILYPNQNVNYNTNILKRLLYVALSRTKENAYILNL